MTIPTIQPARKTHSTQALPANMAAVTHQRYGTEQALELRQLETPTATGDQVLVRVAASSANAGDWFLLTGRPWVIRLFMGITRPRRQVFGQDMAGVVVAVGESVTRFAVGDAVYGEVPGSLAEYIAVPETKLARAPENLSLEEAAAVPIAGNAAFMGLRERAQVQPGDKVLINGASGGVGTFAIQVAKALGAEVTAVCSPRNAHQARALGADHVVDYTTQNFTETTERYDVIFDLVGSQPIRRCLGILSDKGIYIPSVGNATWPLKAACLSLFYRGRIKLFAAAPDASRLADLTQLIEAGQVHPQIERRFERSEYREWMHHQGTARAQAKSLLRF